MLRTLVVPLDGSELAECALPYALSLAKSGGARLVLLRVAFAPLPSEFDWDRQQLAEVADAESYLNKVADRLASPGLSIETVAAYGLPITHILETLDRWHADLVVMATHGRTGLAHLARGSVAEAVLARSTVPVFLVDARPQAAPAPPYDPSTARLLVALDGSSFAETALHTAVDVLGAAGELVVASVVAPAEHVERDEYGRVLAYLDEQEQTATREAHEYLDTLAARLAEQCPGINVKVDVRVGDPATGIVMAAAERGADVVVMATHGRTGIGRAVVGSVAGAVLRTGSTPVLMVRPARAGSRGAESAAPATAVAS